MRRLVSWLREMMFLFPSQFGLPAATIIDNFLALQFSQLFPSANFVGRTETAKAKLGFLIKNT